MDKVQKHNSFKLFSFLTNLFEKSEPLETEFRSGERNVTKSESNWLDSVKVKGKVVPVLN
jgi:hypothetical protein